MTPTARGIQPHEAVRPIRRSDVTVQELDGEALVYDPTTADTHRLNATAYFIWRSCDGRSTTENVADRLAETYDVGRYEATRHARRMLDEFLERGLVSADLPSDP